MCNPNQENSDKIEQFKQEQSEVNQKIQTQNSYQPDLKKVETLEVLDI